MKKNVVIGIVGVIAVVAVIILFSVNKKCEVQINTKGGTIYPNQSLKCGEILQNITDPEIPGFKFVEWYDEETGEVFDIKTPITKSMKIAARYNQIAE